MANRPRDRMQRPSCQSVSLAFAVFVVALHRDSVMAFSLDWFEELVISLKLVCSLPALAQVAL